MLDKTDKTCIIIGDGISLKWFDIKLFKDFNVIPIAFLWFHKDVKHFKIDNSILLEPFWMYPIMRFPSGSGKIFFNPIQKKYKKIIKNNPLTKFYIDRSNYLSLIFNNNIEFIYRRSFFKSSLIKPLATDYNCFSSSFRFSIAYAIKHNYKTIYFLGFDYTHAPARGLHWYEKGRGIENKKFYFEKDFILAARKYINMITITLDGKGEYMEHITYKDFTGVEPFYRENTEIVSSDNLKILSSWPDYNIY